MAKSVRISDDLYEMAATEAALMHRSLAQQIEHWAAIGQAVESRTELADIRTAAIAHMRARDHARVRRGRATARQFAFLPRALVRSAKVVFPEDAFAEFEKK